MLGKENELRKEIHDMEENLKNKVTEQNIIQEKNEGKESSNKMENKVSPCILSHYVCCNFVILIQAIEGQCASLKKYRFSYVLRI